MPEMSRSRARFLGCDLGGMEIHGGFRIDRGYK